jgi:hypothetical protein
MWWTEWQWVAFVSVFFDFLLSVSSHQRSILIMIDVLLLPEVQTGEDWTPSKSNVVSEIGDHWVGKYRRLLRNPLTLGLNPYAQRCLTRLFTRDFSS